jgi:hypothetical protein
MLTTRSAIWLIAEGRNHLDVASAYLRDGDFAGAGEACDRADRCRSDAESKLATQTDIDVGRSLSTLRLDIRIARARIRSGSDAVLVTRGAGN